MESKERAGCLSDEQILDLYFARQERAIAETEKKYCHYLNTVAYNILANEQDAEECLQDTYLRAWNAIPPERPHVLCAFLAKITRNLSLSRYKASKRQKRVLSEANISLDELGECVPDGEQFSDDSAIIADVISRYLKSIPERRMYIFVSRYFYMLTVQQIANRLSCSVALVKKELVLIRKSLRQALEKEGIDV